MPDPPRPGHPATLPAATYNAIAEAVERASGLSVDGGLRLHSGPAGRSIAVPRDPCVWATLGGSSSPYSWTQALPQAGGTTVAGSLAGTTNAYEVNSTASLGSKVVKICPGYPGDWRFYYRSRTATTFNQTLTIRGCNSFALQGATVTFAGATTVTGTTDASGNVVLAVPAGTYTRTISKGRFVTQTASVTIGIATTNTITLSIDSTNYVCVTCCADPWPKTLFVTDPAGTITLTYGTNDWTTFSNAWSGAALRTASGAKNCAGTTLSSVGVPAVFTIFPGSGGTCFLHIAVPGYQSTTSALNCAVSDVYPTNAHTCAGYTGGQSDLGGTPTNTPIQLASVHCPATTSASASFNTGSVGFGGYALIYGSSTAVSISMSE